MLAEIDFGSSNEPPAKVNEAALSSTEITAENDVFSRFKEDEASDSSGDDFDLNIVTKRSKLLKSAAVSESDQDDDKDENENENVIGYKSQVNDSRCKQPKKPKESLKALLKETGALIRQTAVVELSVNVAKPKHLSSILNEALAVAAQSTESGRQAHRALLEEKRKAQQTRLQKLLGPERLAELSRERPKIGAPSALNEEFMVGPGETLKLVNLPDKHGGSHTSTPRKRTGYLAHLPHTKPASVDILNATLSEKISTQSTKAAARLSAQLAQEAARAKAVAAAAERKRQLLLAEKERKLEQKRQQLTAGPKLQDTAKLMTRKPALKPEALQLQPTRPKVIILSEDDEDEDEKDAVGEQIMAMMEEDPEFVDYDADLADEGFVVDEIGLDEMATAADEDEESEAEFSQSESEAEYSQNESTSAEGDESKSKEQCTVDALLSGSFADAATEPPPAKAKAKTGKAASLKPLKVELVKAQRRSTFLDDEAEDEDEELDAELIDEEALERELLESKFIADEDDWDSTEENSLDTRAIHHQLKTKEDMQFLDRLASKFAKQTANEENSFLARLEAKYNAADAEDEFLLDQELLGKKEGGLHFSTAERKLQRLAELEKFNPDYLQKRRQERKPGAREFLFPEEIRAAQQRERAHLDSVFGCQNGPADARPHHSYPSSAHPSSDFYSSATESEPDCDGQDNDDDDETVIYEEEAAAAAAMAAEVDVEDDKVEASESLTRAMQSMNASFNFDVAGSSTAAAAAVLAKPLAKNILVPAAPQASVMVPKAKDAMKAKLAAMQQSEEGPVGPKVFKGFTTK